MARAKRFESLIGNWTAQGPDMPEPTFPVQSSKDVYISDDAKDTYDSDTKDTYLSGTRIDKGNRKKQDTTTDKIRLPVKDTYSSESHEQYLQAFKAQNAQESDEPVKLTKDTYVSETVKDVYSSKPIKKHRNFKVPRVLKDCRVNFLTRPALYESLKTYARQKGITAGEAINRILTAFLEQHQT